MEEKKVVDKQELPLEKRTELAMNEINEVLDAYGLSLEVGYFGGLVNIQIPVILANGQRVPLATRLVPKA